VVEAPCRAQSFVGIVLSRLRAVAATSVRVLMVVRMSTPVWTAAKPQLERTTPGRGRRSTLRPRAHRVVWSASAETSYDGSVLPRPNEYFRSLAAEFDVQASRVRHLIGDAHWGHDGNHKEALVADGMVVQPTPGPNRQFATLVAVTASELWSIERNTNDASKLPLTRVSLGAW
jgi:hypothetical protein